jgi:hypothetical protein
MLGQILQLLYMNTHFPGVPLALLHTMFETLQSGETSTHTAVRLHLACCRTIRGAKSYLRYSRVAAAMVSGWDLHFSKQSDITNFV